MSPPDSGSTVKTVYATPFGDAYHVESCPFLKRYSAKQQEKHHSLSLAEAKSKGMRPCWWCERKGMMR